MLVGRKHKGDENGKTAYKCTYLYYSSSTVTVTNGDWSDGEPESKSDFECPKGQVLVGRKHDGDENGKTYYKCGSLSYEGNKFSWSQTSKSAAISEWKDEYTCPENQVLIGEKHKGDENGNTYYTCATISFDRNPISIKELPSTIELSKIDQKVYNIKGYSAEIDIENAEVFVPDSPFYSSTDDNKRCISVDNKDKNGKILISPMYSLVNWRKFAPLRLMINANWFDVSGPANFPYTQPCTNIFGYSVSNGSQVSSKSTEDNGNKLDSLMFFYNSSTRVTTASIVANSDIGKNNYTNPIAAVSGFIILKNGATVSTSKIPSSDKAKFYWL